MSFDSQRPEPLLPLNLWAVVLVAPVEVIYSLSPHCSGPSLDCY
jgi:hypothetical protein